MLPDGGQIPVGVTSFTSGKNGSYWLVMSTPSAWEAGGVGGGPSLATTMVAVLLARGLARRAARAVRPEPGRADRSELAAGLVRRRRLQDRFRVAGPGWKRHAFGGGAQSVLEMLDAALAE